MKQGEIIIGEEYAFFSTKHDTTPRCIIALEKYQEYGYTKRGVKAKFPNGNITTVNSITIHCSWQEWLAREEKHQAYIEQRHESKMKRTVVIIQLSQALVAAGLNYKVSLRYRNGIDIRLQESQAPGLIELLKKSTEVDDEHK